MNAHRTRRHLLTGLGAASAAIALTAAPRGEAAPGEPLLLGRANRAGSRPTRISSRVALRGALEIENLNPEGKGTGLDVSSGGVGIHALGMVGGTGLFTESRDGRALAVIGRSAFVHAGVATIAAGSADVIVETRYFIHPGEAIIATLQGEGGAGVAVRFAERQSDGFHARVALTKAATRDVVVAFWMVEPWNGFEPRG